MALEATKTKLRLDGRWNLEELSEATRDYTQLYGFAYSLLADLPIARREEIDYIYGKFPWRGGYSTVNFFDQLFHKIPPNLRPEVERIQYASPGFIELSELLLVASIVAGIVKKVCDAINNAHDTYRRVQKGSVDLKLAKIDLANKELELTQRQIAFCESSAKSLIEVFGLTEGQEHLIDQRVQGNAVMKHKILMSVFRRVDRLAKKQNEGKLEVTGEQSDGI
jgi:hypothetical protein